MQGAAPMPDEGEVRMQRLRAILAEMRAAEAAEEQQLTQAIESVAPGTVALVRQASNDLAVNRFNFRQWLRDHLPDWLSEATEMTVVMAATTLVGIYWSGATEHNWAADRPPRLLPWIPIPTPMMATPDACHGGSVVDAVFAKAEAEAETRKHA